MEVKSGTTEPISVNAQILNTGTDGCVFPVLKVKSGTQLSINVDAKLVKFGTATLVLSINVQLEKFGTLQLTNASAQLDRFGMAMHA